MTDESAWLAPAEPKHVSGAVTHVLAACEPNAPERRLVLFTRMLSARRYTAAELAFAARELPFDETVNDKLRFNRPVMPADFERCIKEIRTRRAKLKGKMRLEEAEELVMQFPDDLEISHFRVCGFDDFNRELVRYAPHLPMRTPTGNPAPKDAEGKPYAGSRVADTVHVSETDEVSRHVDDENDAS